MNPIYIFYRFEGNGIIFSHRDSRQTRNGLFPEPTVSAGTNTMKITRFGKM